MQFQQEGEQTTAWLTGDIDSHRSADVGSELLTLDVSGRLDLDMSGVTFLDSSGLSELLQVRKAFEANGVAVGIVAPSAPVVRVLDIAGLLEAFDVRIASD